MKNSTKILLGIIFFAVLALRLYFAFQTPNFSSDSAYFNIRHTEYITEHFKPIIYDDLSYGGRLLQDSHVFHYLLAIFSFILPGMLAYKIIPELLLAALVILVFAIAREITQNEKAALFSALLAGVTPIFYKSTLNQVSVYSLALFLLLYMIYAFFDLKKNTNKFLILALVLPLVHPIGFFFAASMVVYVLLSVLESKKVDPLSKESIILVLFFSVFISFVLYRQAFLVNGLKAVWQNVPPLLMENYFRNISVFETVAGIGILPIILGTTGFLLALKTKKRSIYVLSAFLLTVGAFLALRLIEFNTGIMILGLLLAIISGIAFDRFITYFNMTKFHKSKNLLAIGFIILTILIMGIPSYFASQETINQALLEEEYEALTWIKTNTPEGSTVLGGIDEGHSITAIAQRKNVADNVFSYAPNRYADMEEIFKTQSLVNSLELIKAYNVNYIYLSKRTKELYNVEELVYVRDENCFEKSFYTEKAEIYRVLC